MTVDNRLTWEEQVDNVVCGMQQGIGILKHLAAKLPRGFLLPAAHGIILSKVRYGLAVYGEVKIHKSEPSTGRMKRLQVALNRIARFITGVKLQDRMTTDEVLKRANLPHIIN